MKIDLKKKILFSFTGVFLLIAGYLKFPVNDLWSQEGSENEINEEETRLQYEDNKEESREVRFVGCNGIF